MAPGFQAVCRSHRYAWADRALSPVKRAGLTREVEDEAEGHAICLDENLQESDHLPSSHRCFKLAGTQDWDDTFVYNVAPVEDTNENHYKIKIGDQSGQHIPLGIKINYLALVQDNDKNLEGGESTFKNIKVYEDTKTEKVRKK